MCVICSFAIFRRGQSEARLITSPLVKKEYRAGFKYKTNLGKIQRKRGIYNRNSSNSTILVGVQNGEVVGMDEWRRMVAKDLKVVY